MIDRNFEEMGLVFVESQTPHAKRMNVLGRMADLFFEHFGREMPSLYEETDEEKEKLEIFFAQACEEFFYTPRSKAEKQAEKQLLQEPINTGVCLWNLAF